MGPELLIGGAVLALLFLRKRGGSASSSTLIVPQSVGAQAPSADGSDTGTMADGSNPLVDEVQSFSGQPPSPGSFDYTPNGSGLGGLDTRF